MNERNERLNERNERLPLIPVAWADVKPGDIVYTDSYQGGKFPNANPRICGPFTVHRTGPGRFDRTLRTIGRRFVQTTFIHWDETLLRLSDGTDGGND